MRYLIREVLLFLATFTVHLAGGEGGRDKSWTNKYGGAISGM
jgi:hypothetical protein